jgi:hypothetical protein
MRVLGAVLRDIRGASSHQHSEAGRWLGLIGYRVFVSFVRFYLRDFVIHSDGVSPAGVWHCTLLYILDCIVLYYYRFVYFEIYLILFISPFVRTSLRAYVARLSTPNPIYYFWGVTDFDWNLTVTFVKLININHKLKYRYYDQYENIKTIIERFSIYSPYIYIYI